MTISMKQMSVSQSHYTYWSYYLAAVGGYTFVG